MSKIVRVPSDDVRGEDTWVDISPFTLGESKKYRRMAKAYKAERLAEIKKELKQINREKGPASEVLVELARAELEELTADTSYEVGWDVIARRIIDWNWEDDGKKLPVPTPDNLEAFDDLTNEEIKFLTEAILGQAEVVKK